MNGSVRVGRVVGVPLRMHWSVPLLAVLLAYGLGRQALPALAPGRSDTVYAFASVVGAVLLMGSLLPHETAHAALRDALAVDVLVAVVPDTEEARIHEIRASSSSSGDRI